MPRTQGRASRLFDVPCPHALMLHARCYLRVPLTFQESNTRLSLRPTHGTMSSFLSRPDLSSTSDISSVLSPRPHDRNRRSVLSVSLSRMPSTSSSITGITRQLIGGIRGTNRNADIVPRSLLAREAANQAGISIKR